MTKAYMMYKGEVIPVIVESYFEGGSGRYANVVAVTGYPFHSSDVQAQGDTHGAWNCNGYRVRVDFITVEDAHPADEAQAIEKRIDDLLSGDPARMAKYNENITIRPYASYARTGAKPLSADEANFYGMDE